jgi:hypothetical protein
LLWDELSFLLTSGLRRSPASLRPFSLWLHAYATLTSLPASPAAPEGPDLICMALRLSSFSAQSSIPAGSPTAHSDTFIPLLGLTMALLAPFVHQSGGLWIKAVPMPIHLWHPSFLPPSPPMGIWPELTPRLSPAVVHFGRLMQYMFPKHNCRL